MPDNELAELTDFQKAVRGTDNLMMTAFSQNLKVDKHGRITAGVWWIGCKANGRKPAKPKHQCPDCGAKHAIRK